MPISTPLATALPVIVWDVTRIATQLLGLGVLAAGMTALAALLYRWYTRESVPLGLALLIGLGAVALYLNTTTALGQAIGGGSGAVSAQRDVALFNIAAFLLAGAAGAGGRRLGDRMGTSIGARTAVRDVDEEIGRLVRTVGRVIGVELPEDIDDIVGYDPVPEGTKADLAGKRFVFPRNLTVEELRTRLVARLKTDYGVGHVDVELAEDGTVEYLAVGSRAAGIGPTLPPGTVAVTVRADPALAASSGDLVEVWRTDPSQRVLTGEIRGVAGDVVTLAVDAGDAPAVDPGERYRLVTLPVNDRPEREFASLLRLAEDTFDSVTVTEGSPLDGLPIGALDITIIAIAAGAGQPTVLPDADVRLSSGDRIYAIALPERLRRLETAARALERDSISTDDGFVATEDGASDSDVDSTDSAADSTVSHATGSDATGTDSKGTDTTGTDSKGTDTTRTDTTDSGTDAGASEDGATPADR